MLPNTVDRVPLNTSEEINQRIARETNRRVNFYAANPIGIERRLHVASAVAMGGDLRMSADERKERVLRLCTQLQRRAMGQHAISMGLTPGAGFRAQPTRVATGDLDRRFTVKFARKPTHLGWPRVPGGMVATALSQTLGKRRQASRTSASRYGFSKKRLGSTLRERSTELPEA
jgi:hypothetical protein